MFLVRRKVDGKWWSNPSRRHWLFFDKRDPWADCPDGIRPFKTRGGCKNAMQSFLYEKTKDHRWIKHPEWFDQKFEIVPVFIKIGGSG